MFERVGRILGWNKAPEDQEGFIRRRVLVVDDNEVDLKLVRRTVEKMGHAVLTAENGREGFRMAKEEKPDLILSDCRMPEMDGVEMCRKIKEDELTKNIPMVFLTSVDTPSTVVGCFDMGVENYMCKPINPKLLTNQIKMILEEFIVS